MIYKMSPAKKFDFRIMLEDWLEDWDGEAGTLARFLEEYIEKEVKGALNEKA